MKNRHKTLYDYGFPMSYSITSKSDVFNFLNNTNKNTLTSFLVDSKTHHLFKKFFPVLYNDIMNNITCDIPFKQKLWHYFNNDNDLHLGICPVCGKRCKFKNFKDGYYLHCSLSCTQLDEDIQNKIKNTNLERYGVERASQNVDIKLKTIETNLEIYGVKHHTQSDNVKEKIKQTRFDRYGVDNHMKIYKFKEKIKQTCLDRYGVDNYSKTNEFNEKYKQTR